MDPLAAVLIGVAVFVGGAIVRDRLARSERRRGKVKTCPECAEVVGASAEFCRVCGHRFHGNRPRGDGFWGAWSGLGPP